MRKIEVEQIGYVTDLPDDPKWSWAMGYDATQVKGSLFCEGFSDEDLEEFGIFLVKTESGDYTEIYGVKHIIPYNWYHAYRFKVDGRFL